jgi:hypothetical protein
MLATYQQFLFVCLRHYWFKIYTFLSRFFFRAASITCNQSAWTQPPSLCVPVCPALTLPDNADNCTKQQFIHNFTTPTIFSSWYQFWPASVPVQFQPFMWSVSNGVLTTNASSQCVVSTAAPALAFLAQPAFLDLAAKGQWYRYSVMINVTSGGLCVR